MEQLESICPTVYDGLPGQNGLIAATINDKIYVVGGGPEPGLTVSGANEIFQVLVSDTMVN